MLGVPTTAFRLQDTDTSRAFPCPERTTRVWHKPKKITFDSIIHVMKACLYLLRGWQVTSSVWYQESNCKLVPVRDKSKVWALKAIYVTTEYNYIPRLSFCIWWAANLISVSKTQDITFHPLNINPFVWLCVEKSLKKTWKQIYRVCKTRSIPK